MNATNMLGRIYLDGLIVQKDLEAAKLFYELAVKRGNTKSLNEFQSSDK